MEIIRPVKLEENVIIQKMYVGAVVLAKGKVIEINDDLFYLLELIQQIPFEDQQTFFCKVGYQKLKPSLRLLIQRGVLVYV